MAQRSRIVLVVALAAFIILLSGCSGSGSDGFVPASASSGGGTQGVGTQTIGGAVTSPDGNAQLIVPNGIGISAAAVSLKPASLTFPDPNIAVGTAYTANTIGPTEDDEDTLPMVLTLRYNPADLPAGAVPAQLGIAFLSQSAVFQGWIALKGVTVNTTRDTVSAPVLSLQTYAGVALSPFAIGDVNGLSRPLACQFTGTVSGVLSLAIDPSGSVGAIEDGSATPDYGNGAVSLTGAISLTITLGTDPGSTTFTGMLHSSGGKITGSGTWAGENASSGVWTIP